MSLLAERRQEEKERRRAEILDAAESVASGIGIDAMTMDMVARRARLSRALLYVYFNDKFDLTAGLCERGLQILHQRFLAAVGRQRQGIDKVTACGRAYVAFAQEFPVYFAALSQLQAHSPEAANEHGNELACRACGERVHGVLIQSLQLGMADGSVRRDAGDPLLVALTLWGFMHGIIQIASTKAEVLAEDGVSVKQLVDSALLMCTRSLQPAA